MFSRFFIERPKFALVISILIVLVGGISIPLLPIESHAGHHSADYSRFRRTIPGADAGTVEQAVTAPIEEQVNGVEDMIYMASKSGSDGSMKLTVSFDIGTDVDMAQVMTKNRVAVAEPLLPQEVMRQGVKVDKQSTAMVEMVSLFSPNQHLRRTLHLQLHRHAHQGPTRRASNGVGNGHRVRGEGLLHADLAQSRSC